MAKQKKIEFDGKAIALFKIDGNYFATDDTCTHEKASISDGEIDGDIVTCPHHGARFDIKTGQALSLPAMFSVGKISNKGRGKGYFIKN